MFPRLAASGFDKLWDLLFPNMGIIHTVVQFGRQERTANMDFDQYGRANLQTEDRKSESNAGICFH